MRLVFTITKTDSGFSTLMDSPDQNAFGIPVNSTSFENSTLKIIVTNAQIDYVGVLGTDNKIIGDFKQGGLSFPLNLSKEKVEIEKIIRPQEPSKPYPYYTEEVTFENKNAGIQLAGTLSLPKKEGLFPAVILISGSGPQNRDEELLGHKPFLVLSNFLTNNGIAVLRFDDRGTALSKGDFETATSLDFSTDVEAALQFLLSRKEINKTKIGLIGHSEGGIIAPMVANKSKNIAFIVLLAGTGIQGDELLLLQQELLGKASGINDEALKKLIAKNKEAFKIVKNATDQNQLKLDLMNYLKQSLNDKPEGISDDDFINLQVNQLSSNWLQYFIKYNPLGVIKLFDF